MCRSIKRLRHPEGAAGEQDIRAAALQFVRKVSGMQKPSTMNQAAFAAAIEAITAATGELLEQLPPLRRPAEDKSAADDPAA